MLIKFWCHQSSQLRNQGEGQLAGNVAHLRGSRFNDTPLRSLKDKLKGPAIF